MRSPTLVLATSLLLLVLGGGPAPANPLFAGADPHAAVIGGRFWMFPTLSRVREPQFAAYSSTDLRRWDRHEAALRLADVKWIGDDGESRHSAWAPAIAQRGGRYYFYYSVGPNRPTPSRIGVAVGIRPQGPFKDSGQPLVTGEEGFEAIDPMVFIDPADNRPYLYAGGSDGSTLRVWELETDMVRLKRRIPVDNPPKFTEGAFMHRRGGKYYLSYSHGGWQQPNYSVHYATADSPTGPWNYRGAILESDARHKGPGHHSFIRHPETGEWFIVYHRWETTRDEGPYRGSRRIAIERIEYREDGDIVPVKMTDTPPLVQPLR